MSTTTAEIDAYAASVRAALADLPAADRDALVADLEDHLAEVAAEGELPDLLGPPAAYAAELRSSAGLPPSPAPGAAPTRRPRPEWMSAALAFLPELVPAWWVLRGLVLGSVLGLVVGSVLLVVLLAAAAVPASVVLGRRAAAGAAPRWVDIGLSVVAAGLLLLSLGLAGRSTTSAGYDGDPVPAGTGVRLDGVTNLYPYSSDGKPLTDVQLYDQNGDPVELRAEYDADGRTLTRVPRRTTDGQVTDNAYPQEQNVDDVDDPARPDLPVQPPVVRPPGIVPR